MVFDIKDTENDDAILMEPLNVKKIDIHLQEIPQSFNNEILKMSKNRTTPVTPMKNLFYEKLQSERYIEMDQCKVWKQIPITDGSWFMSESSSIGRHISEAEKTELNFQNLNTTAKKQICMRRQSRTNIDSAFPFRRPSCTDKCEKQENVGDSNKTDLTIKYCISEYKPSNCNKFNNLSPKRMNEDNAKCLRLSSDFRKDKRPLTCIRTALNKKNLKSQLMQNSNISLRSSNKSSKDCIKVTQDSQEESYQTGTSSSTYFHKKIQSYLSFDHKHCLEVINMIQIIS